MQDEHRTWLYSKREGDGLPWRTEPRAEKDAAPRRSRRQRGPGRPRWI